MEETEKSIADYVEMLWRRKIYIIIIFPLLTVITVVIAFMLPPVYHSKGVVLIEQQEIPSDLIRSTVTSFAQQQVEVIQQRLMTTAKIMQIVEKHKLYTEFRKNNSVTDVATRFKTNIMVEMINANVIDPANGRAKRASIAFTIAFMDSSPLKAQRVASELVTLFLNENVRSRTSKASETSLFLKLEADKLQKSVQFSEQGIADFKVEYSDSLPELLQFNLSMVGNLDRQLALNQSASSDVAKQISFLELELSNLSPQLVTDLAAGANFPEEVALSLLKVRLKQQKNKYSDSHPDIIRIRRQIKNLVDSGVVENSAEDSVIGITNPVYRQVKFKIESLEKEIYRLRQQRDKQQKDKVEYERRISQTHQVQQGYENLTRDYKNTLAKYQDLRAKQLEAEVSQSMESENKAESFILIEPPVVPSRPSKPDRFKVILMGVLLSGGAALGLVILLEMLDPGIRGSKEIERLTGAEPLMTIPMFAIQDNVQFLKDHKLKIIVGLVMLAIVTALIIHNFFIGLDLLWFKFLNKTSLL